MVSNLRDALNRIIHAQKLVVGFEQLLPQVSVIDGRALVVPYIQAATDRKKLAFIDPFALSDAFLYGGYPKLVALISVQSCEVQLMESKPSVTTV